LSLKSRKKVLPALEVVEVLAGSMFSRFSRLSSSPALPLSG
jgi:hypothetical protein